MRWRSARPVRAMGLLLAGALAAATGASVSEAAAAAMPQQPLSSPLAQLPGPGQQKQQPPATTAVPPLRGVPGARSAPPPSGYPSYPGHPAYAGAGPVWAGVDEPPQRVVVRREPVITLPAIRWALQRLLTPVRRHDYDHYQSYAAPPSTKLTE